MSCFVFVLIFIIKTTSWLQFNCLEPILALLKCRDYQECTSPNHINILPYVIYDPMQAEILAIIKYENHALTMHVHLIRNYNEAWLF